MKRVASFLMITAIALAFGLTNSADAALHERGTYLVYDDDLDVTWLKDTTASRGRLTFSEAQDLVNEFNSGLYFGGSNWRLPATDLTDSGCTGPFANGTNCTGSELGHMYYIELGNQAGPPPGGGLTNRGPFVGLLQADIYWSGTQDAQGDAWFFNFFNGFQDTGPTGSTHCAWLVHDGDLGSPALGPGICAESRRRLTGGTDKSLNIRFVSSEDQACRMTHAVIDVGDGNTINRASGVTCVPSTHTWTGGGTSQVTITFNPPLSPGDSSTECISDSLGFYWDSGQTITLTFDCAGDVITYSAAYDEFYDVTTYKTFKISEATLGNCRPPDCDNDGVSDEMDNCECVSNANQEDTDNDGLGNVCDNCPITPNPEQEDSDGDHIGDACERQCSDGKDNDGDGAIDYPDDEGCIAPYDDDESDGETICDPPAVVGELAYFLREIIKIPSDTFSEYVEQNRKEAVAVKAGVLDYLLCVSPKIIEGIEPPICLAEPVTTGRAVKCPPLDCRIDGPGCMDPYQYTRAFVADSVLKTVGLWSEGFLTNEEFVDELKKMVKREEIRFEKERPKKTRYLPNLTVGRGILIGLGLIILGSVFTALFRRPPRPK